MKFNEWLQQRMTAEGYTVRSLSIKIGYGRPTVNTWLRGVHIPRAEAMECIEVLFGDVPDDVVDGEYKRANMSLRRSMDRRRVVAMISDGATPREAAAKTGISITSVLAWWRYENSIKKRDGHWAGCQMRHLVQWRRDGRDWSYIAQCLGRSVEDCQAKYEYLVSPQVPAPESR